MSKEQRQAAFHKRAFDLAATGRYRDYLDIESALSGEFPEAREWLDRNSIREDIRLACLNARRTPPG